MKDYLFRLLLLSTTCSSLIAKSQVVIPTSYTATPGDHPLLIDDTGNQLSDGILGSNNSNEDLGNGIAYEWVGWANKSAVIEFSFGTEVTIQTLRLGIARDDAGQTLLPLSTSVSGAGIVEWIGYSGIADGTRGWLEMGGPFTGTSLNLTITTQTGKWVLVDEVQFIGTAVPEPGEWALAISSGMFCVAMWRCGRRLRG